MSTYYKDTLSGNPIYRIAAARVTFEKLDGTIGELNLAGGGGGGAESWAAVQEFSDYPAFLAAGDTAQEARDIIDAPSKGDIPDWGSLVGKPAVVGAGATAAAARTAITAAASGANGDITSITGLTTPLSVLQGGTGVTTVLALAAGLGIGYMVPGQVVQTVGNVDTIVDNGIRAMTTTTTGRPTGTANGDVVVTLVSSGFGAQIAILNSDKLVFRTYNAGTTSWRAWKDVTATALV